MYSRDVEAWRDVFQQDAKREFADAPQLPMILMGISAVCQVIDDIHKIADALEIIARNSDAK